MKEKLKNLPDSAGVYMFRDKSGNVMYIGKAVSLKKRVSGYFRKSGKALRISAMSRKIADLDFIVLKSEEEALLLEDRLIKEYQPKYNVDLKDDKRYPSVLVTTSEAWPKIKIARKRNDDDNRYFGPYTDSGALRRVLRFLQKTFKLRRCNLKLTGQKTIRPCLYYHTGECMAPCSGNVSPLEYHEAVRRVCMLLEGKGAELIGQLRSKMFYMSRHRNFEKAAKIRDLIRDIENIVSHKTRKTVLAKLPRGGLALGRSACESLKNVLNLPDLPERIDAFDVSCLFGDQAVGSMVVFRNGIPSKNAYRRFRIKTVTGNDDYAMIEEIVYRRYRRARALAEKTELPGLILIDGGKGQFSAAKKALDKLGLKDIRVVGLAKKFEELYTPSLLRLSKDSPALQLLMRVRDEAHRFAVDYHRKLRSKDLGLKKKKTDDGDKQTL